MIFQSHVSNDLILIDLPKFNDLIYYKSNHFSALLLLLAHICVQWVRMDLKSNPFPFHNPCSSES